MDQQSRVMGTPGMELKEGFVCVKKGCCCTTLAVLKASLCFTCQHKQEEHVPSQTQSLIARVLEGNFEIILQRDLNSSPGVEEVPWTTLLNGIRGWMWEI